MPGRFGRRKQPRAQVSPTRLHEYPSGRPKSGSDHPAHGTISTFLGVSRNTPLTTGATCATLSERGALGSIGALARKNGNGNDYPSRGWRIGFAPLGLHGALGMGVRCALYASRCARSLCRRRARIGRGLRNPRARSADRGYHHGRLRSPGGRAGPSRTDSRRLAIQGRVRRHPAGSPSRHGHHRNPGIRVG